jgi:hypothetical protein
VSTARMNRSLLRVIAAVAAACATTASAQQPAGPAGPIATRAATSAAAAGSAGAAIPPRMVTPVVLPGTRASAFSTIHGNALDSNDAGLPDTLIRLRDARRGHIVESQRTDKNGLFAFPRVDPGSYVVELLSGNRRVAAASELLNVNAGEAVSTFVKLPSRRSFAGWMGRAASQALAVTSAAAASGVLATGVTGEHVSPQK